MNLRPELVPPEIDEDRLRVLAEQIEDIADRLERGEPVDQEIETFNRLTGHSYTAEDFRHYWESRSSEEFAAEAARPAPRKIPDITREELVEIVRRLETDPMNSDYYLALFEANVPHPAASDLIYNPPDELRDASPEEIVDAALAYRPFAL